MNTDVDKTDAAPPKTGVGGDELNPQSRTSSDPVVTAFVVAIAIIMTAWIALIGYMLLLLSDCAIN
jgi:hypothetical protein